MSSGLGFTTLAQFKKHHTNDLKYFQVSNAPEALPEANTYSFRKRYSQLVSFKLKSAKWELTHTGNKPR